MLYVYSKKKGKQKCLCSHPLHKPSKRYLTVETTGYNFLTIFYWKSKGIPITMQHNSFCLENTAKVVMFSKISFMRVKLHLILCI